MAPDVARIIEKLGLAAHPEGGWYKETYRSDRLTNIHFLLAADNFSAWHRIDGDETWNFYRGTGLLVAIIHPDGVYEERLLGPDGPWQTTIPAHVYFASAVPDARGYALVGCTVAPPFRFEGFELPSRETLLARYPQHAAAIRRYTRS